MRFWDASAVVPLLVEQPLSARAFQLLAEDPDVVVWWSTPVECASALARVRREGALPESAERDALATLELLRSGWHEILPGEALRVQALRVLRLHPLRSADALQLAAVLEWAGAPASSELVCFDPRLGAAAEREGFRVLGI
ncbi:MAG TPA: type II toxin-antitoxin system VapC family toxin [Longimicrobiales bacterium]|nr:type II toxin-antitoxin system VapC family toxin [Longimicrobiales bacterium]